MPAGRKVNMVAGRGQASINFTSLGVGRHAKNIRRVIDQRVFINKPGCCDNPEKEEQVEEVEEEQEEQQEQQEQESVDRIAFDPIELNMRFFSTYTVTISLDKEIIGGDTVKLIFNDPFGGRLFSYNGLVDGHGREITFNSSNWESPQTMSFLPNPELQNMGISAWPNAVSVLVIGNIAYYNGFVPNFTGNIVS